MSNKRVSPLPGQTLHVVGDWEAYDASMTLTETSDVHEADIITSLAKSGNHKLVLDIDFPATLIPSSTNGHFHLYVDHEIEWEKYLRVIEAMAEAGLLEDGFVNASKQRGFTAVRLPWVKKSDAPITPRCVGCGKGPGSMAEYRQLASDDGYSSPSEAVRRNEGTFNRSNGHFYCTACYIAAGQPNGIAP